MSLRNYRLPYFQIAETYVRLHVSILRTGYVDIASKFKEFQECLKSNPGPQRSTLKEQSRCPKRAVEKYFGGGKDAAHA